MVLEAMFHVCPHAAAKLAISRGTFSFFAILSISADFD